MTRTDLADDGLRREAGGEAGAGLAGGEPELASIPVNGFGRYNLVGKLGHGGMAEALLAYFDGPAGVKKVVVLKRIHRHLRSSPDHLRMFLDEAALAARMSHPNVVQTIELGEVEGFPYMAMEYLEGQSFDRIWRLAAGGGRALPVPVGARIVADALEGLHYAHELTDFDGSPLGIVHRDVSPHNIFVAYDGTTKILDFGVAKVASGETTASGVLKGKCSYVAPEQAHGQRVDRRADLWSMGVVLWEALVGRRLFKSSSDAATLIEVLTAPVPLASEVNPAVPPALAAVAARALQRNRDRRYASAAEMRDDLLGALAELEETGTEAAVSELVRGMFAESIARHRQVLEACLARAESRSEGAPPAARRVRGPAALPAELPEEEISRAPIPAGPVVQDGARSGAGPRGRRPRRSTVEVLVALLGVVGVGFSVAMAVRVGGPLRSGPNAPTGSTAPARLAPDRAGPAVLGPEREAGAGPGEGRGGAASSAVVTWQDQGSTLAAEPSRGSGLDSGSELGAGRSAPGESPSARPGGARDRRAASAGVGTPPARPDPEAQVGSPRPPEPDPEPEPEPEPGVEQGDGHVSADEAPPVPVELGHLTLDTLPWTTVRLGGRRLGDTPLIRYPLPPGAYELTLVNVEQGLRTTISVTIRAGETTSRRLAVR